MIICIADLVPAEVLAETQAFLASARFIAGSHTAGWHAQQVKHNLQIAPEDIGLKTMQEKILAPIAKHSVTVSAILPRSFRPLLFNRYESGMFYGDHVDDALMGKADSGGITRSDISFTLFLSAPENYDGGELVISSTSGEQAFKLDAGQAVFYPSTSLHRVTEVTRGVRDAAVGWLQSLVRDPAQREMLFELDSVRRAIFGREGKTPEFDRISTVYSNLLRTWAET